MLLFFLVFVLSIQRESLVGILQKERGKRERDYIKAEIEYTDDLAEKVNFKECTCDARQSGNKNER